MTQEQSSLLELPEGWWRHELASIGLMQPFERYTLGLMAAVPSGSEYKVAVYSGLKIFYRGLLIWITAGHVIDEIVGAMRELGNNIKVMAWLDPTGDPESGVFTVHHRDFLTFSRNTDDHDSGFAILKGLDVESVLNNAHGRLLTNIGVGGNTLLNAEGHFLVGHPGELVSYAAEQFDHQKILNSATTKQIALPMREIISLNELPVAVRRDGDFFYGHLLPFEDEEIGQPANIKGMSGGPVLAVARTENGRLAVELVGIQGSWHKESRIIRAERIDAVLQWIYETIDSIVP